MQLISKEYARINEELHESRKDYGTSGRKYVNYVRQLCETFKTTDVLDYGCGKSTLAINLPFNIKQYDPAITKFKELPKPADIVVCTDVLEHIEPVFLEDVLDHLQALTRVACFVSISTRIAKKTLSDGRNAHLNVRPARWWLDRLWDRFELGNFTLGDREFQALLLAKNYQLNQLGVQQ